jgi:alanyl-tRNA synthetase
MKSADIRRLFIDYFKQQGHTAVTSGPLVPAGDATLLFTNAGMVQFKDVFLGRDKRPYTRAVTSQCCIRAGGKHNDLENVGYTARHHTFFEMLGNFSFGDYFKREAIHFAWNFLTQSLKIDPKKLCVTVYEKDDEAAEIWLKDFNQVAIRCGDKDNFWSMGDTGPCGPCSEIFYDHGADIMGGLPGSPDADGDRYIEIWNLVFMQFNRLADGKMTPLPKPSVDTGMGLERLSAVMQGVHNNYETDLFTPLIAFAQKLYFEAHAEFHHDLKKLDQFDLARFKILADHIRSSAFLIAEGVYPSNEGRGYVLRRIIRRALRHGSLCQIQTPFFYRLVEPLISIMGEAYPQLIQRRAIIEKTLRQEEEQFTKTLSNGLALLETSLEQTEDNIIPGELVFKLYDTYGFPVDLTADIAREKGITMDIAGFEAAMQRQREMSQKASSFKADYSDACDINESSHFHGYEYLELSGVVQKIIKRDDAVGIILDHTPFYAESGGQVGDEGDFFSENEKVFVVQDTQKKGSAVIHFGQLIKPINVGDMVFSKVNKEKRQATRIHHSVTHLLHAALQAILGSHVEQKGSIVTPEKTRFDFSHNEAVTSEQMEQIEQWVNEKILQNVSIDTDVLPYEEAKKSGAMALFGEKYSDIVRVLTMGDFSKELCGGTHAHRTGDMGLFKIISENGISAGVRRIEAVAGSAALHWVQQQELLKHQACHLLHTNMEQLPNKIEQLLEVQRSLQKSMEECQKKLLAHSAEALLEKDATDISDVTVLIKILDNTEAKYLRTLMDTLKSQLGQKSFVIVLVTIKDDMMQVIAGVSKDYVSKKIPSAKEIVQIIAQKGGGRDDLAQGGAKIPTDLHERLAKIQQNLEKNLAI